MAHAAPKSSRARARKARHRRRPRSRFQRWLLRYGWLLPVGAILIGGGILAVTYAFASIPLPRDIDYLDSSAEVYDRRGDAIGTFSNEVRRFLIDTSELKAYVGEAVVAAEDRDFYRHNGVSVRGIARAAWANLSGGEIAQGGSTITQQYIKNAVLTPERTLARKVKEAILAVKLERRYSKDEILGFYLNTIYLGRGAYGIEAAARAYFGKHAVDLTLGEAAYLAGIIPSPESYQPDENPRGAEARRNGVIDDMVAQGLISNFNARAAKREKLDTIESDVGEQRQQAAYFMEWIRRDFLTSEFEDCLFTCGLKIYTTLDPLMQEYAEDAVAAHLTERTDPEAALVSVTPRGEVRAFVGGRAFNSVKKARGFIYASDVGRQAGSALKPFTLLAAIEDGISPQSRFPGHSPMTINDIDCEPDGTWEVDNFGGQSYGTLTLDQATTNSVNTVYAQLVSEVGPENVADLLEDFGFSPSSGRQIPPYCSLALGGSNLNVTAVDMARAYAGFAGRGRLPAVSPIRYITNSAGECIKEYLPNRDVTCDEGPEAPPEPVVEENSVDVLNQVLEHVVEGGTATAANIGRDVAGKTGTTQEHVDAWFAGYVPQLATVVWMGYPLDAGPDKKRGSDDDFVPRMEYCSDPAQCRPVHGIEVTGGSFPARIWAAYMGPATSAMEPLSFELPEDVPDKVINSPRPLPPSVTPKPSRTALTTPTATPSPTEPPPPTAAPSDEPTIIAPPTTGPGD